MFLHYRSIFQAANRIRNASNESSSVGRPDLFTGSLIDAPEKGIAS